MTAAGKSLGVARGKKGLAVRRTQQERRAATRASLVGATIVSLIERGHSATTTTHIQQRTSLAPGVLHYHFPTKADLLAAAYVELVTARYRRVSSQAKPTGGMSDRIRSAIRLLRDDAVSPEFQATLELVRAARTDTTLRDALQDAQPRLRPLLSETAEALLGPDLVEHPRVGPLFRVISYAMVGIGMQADVLTPDQHGAVLDDLLLIAEQLMLEA